MGFSNAIEVLLEQAPVPSIYTDIKCPKISWFSHSYRQTDHLLFILRLLRT